MADAPSAASREVLRAPCCATAVAEASSRHLLTALLHRETGGTPPGASLAHATLEGSARGHARAGTQSLLRTPQPRALSPFDGTASAVKDEPDRNTRASRLMTSKTCTRSWQLSIPWRGATLSGDGGELTALPSLPPSRRFVAETLCRRLQQCARPAQRRRVLLLPTRRQSGAALRCALRTGARPHA